MAQDLVVREGYTIEVSTDNGTIFHHEPIVEVKSENYSDINLADDSIQPGLLGSKLCACRLERE